MSAVADRSELWSNEGAVSIKKQGEKGLAKLYHENLKYKLGRMSLVSFSHCGSFQTLALWINFLKLTGPVKSLHYAILASKNDLLVFTKWYQFFVLTGHLNFHRHYNYWINFSRALLLCLSLQDFIQ